MAARRGLRAPSTLTTLQVEAQQALILTDPALAGGAVFFCEINHLASERFARLLFRAARITPGHALAGFPNCHLAPLILKWTRRRNPGHSIEGIKMRNNQPIIVHNPIGACNAGALGGCSK